VRSLHTTDTNEAKKVQGKYQSEKEKKKMTGPGI
jgi:hypothetical protein